MLGHHRSRLCLDDVRNRWTIIGREKTPNLFESTLSLREVRVLDGNQAEGREFFRTFDYLTSNSCGFLPHEHEKEKETPVKTVLRYLFFVCLALLVSNASNHAAADTITVCVSGCDKTSIIAAVESSSDGDVIEISAGTYAEGNVIDLQGKSITLRGAADQDDDGFPETILDGQNLHPVLRSVGDGSGSPVFENLHVTRGLVLTSNDAAGMYIQDCNPTLERCAFSFNVCPIYNSAEAIWTQDCSLVLRECTFKQNGYGDTGYDDDGYGTVYGTGGSIDVRHCVFTSNRSLYGALTIEYMDTAGLQDCQFNDNYARYYGGAVYVEEVDDAVIQNCEFDRNFCYGAGGAFYIYKSNTSFTDSHFNENFTQNSRGGAVYLSQSRSDFTSCRFEENSSRLDGGAIHASWGSTTIATDCTFAENSTTNGDGGAVSISGNDEVVFRECIFDLNSAGDIGGSIYLDDCPSVIIEESAVTQSTSTKLGGGIHSRDTDLVLTSTIVCGNFPDQIYGVFDGSGSCLSSTCIDQDMSGVPDPCEGAITGTISVPGDYPTIHEAVDWAADGSTIELAAGVYQIDRSVSLNGKELIVRGAVDVNGDPATTLDGQNATTLIVCASGEAAGTRFENLIITNGSGTDGGGMTCIGSSPTLKNCRFEDNHASQYGGAIYSDRGAVSIVNCRFHQNSAAYGGALSGRGESRMADPVFAVEGCRFTENQASSNGGACWINGLGSLTISECNFDFNQAGTYGGAIRGDYRVKSIVVDDTFFTGNSAGHQGGAIDFNYSGSLQIRRCTFNAQDAGSYGGCLSASRSENLSIEDCAMTGNVCGTGSGGAIYVHRTPAAMSGSVVCGNTRSQIYGANLNDGNCVAVSCDDFDGSGTPDMCEGSVGGVISVPGDHPTIQSAIDWAAADSIIEIDGGRYLTDATLDLQGKSITLRGRIGPDGTLETIIDAGGNHGVMRCVTAEGPESILEGLRFVNGSTSTGGGLFCYASSPTVIGCWFEDNDASTSGGGIYSRYGAPSITDTMFMGNTSKYNAGGMVLEDAAGQTLVEDCVFDSNTSTWGGGGIAIFSSDITITNSQFLNNTGRNGGGINYYGPSNLYSGVVRNCTIKNNTATDSGPGGGVDSSGSSHLEVHDSVICGNVPNAVRGVSTASSGNCLANSCDDADGNGTPDVCDSGTPEVLNVPSDFATVNAAIDAASYGDTVVIAAGTHLLSAALNPSGKVITVRGQIDSQGEPITILDAQGGSSVLEFSSIEGSSTIFENLVLTGGAAPSGAGLYCAGASPQLTNCVFRDNSATYDGGGIFLESSNPTLNRCRIVMNQARRGGGMYCSTSDPILNDCEIQRNTATQELGGGIYCGGGSLPILTDTTVCENVSDQLYGGYENNGGNCFSSSCVDTDGDGTLDSCESESQGPVTLFVPSAYPTIESALTASRDGDTIEIASGTYAPAGTLSIGGKAVTIRGAVDSLGNPTTTIDGQSSIRLFNCTSGESSTTVFENLIMTRGYPDDDEGGAMFFFGTNPTVRNCEFTDNEASDGAAVFCDSGASPTFIDCSFLFNEGCYGGGICALNHSNPLVTGCLFRGNDTDCEYGGGIYLEDASATVVDCVFLENVSKSGGGVYICDSSMDVVDCVFTGNSPEGIEVESGSVLRLSGSSVCENTEDEVVGDIVDQGGNCIFVSCGGCDFDGDGLDNDAEDDATTDPYDPDSDGDGLNDGDEIAGGTDPNVADSDGDGVEDGQDPCPVDVNDVCLEGPAINPVQNPDGTQTYWAGNDMQWGIQEAIDDCNPGDTVVVRAGDYVNSIVVDKPNITIRPFVDSSGNWEVVNLWNPTQGPQAQNGWAIYVGANTENTYIGRPSRFRQLTNGFVTETLIVPGEYGGSGSAIKVDDVGGDCFTFRSRSVDNTGVMSVGGRATFAKCVFTAHDGFGGGVVLMGGSNTTAFVGCDFENLYANGSTLRTDVPGLDVPNYCISIYASAGTMEPTFTGCEFNDNRGETIVHQNGGGGSWAQCVFGSNDALVNQSGIVTLHACNPQFDECRFEDNLSGYGTIFMNGAGVSSLDPVRFNNCEFMDNDTIDGRWGGVIYAEDEESAYGSAPKVIFNRCEMDANNGQDGSSGVDQDDFVSPWFPTYRQGQPNADALTGSQEDPTCNPSADLNGDGIVNGADMGIMFGAWGTDGSL